MDSNSFNKRKRPVCDTDCNSSQQLTAEKRLCTPPENSLLSDGYGLIQYCGPPHENKHWQNLYWPQPQFDDTFLTPVTPADYGELSSDESVCTHESIPTTPEGGLTQGTTPEDGFTPLDSPPLFNIFSAPYAYDVSTFEVTITPADLIEVTAPPGDPPTEQANNTSPICPSLEAQEDCPFPFGAGYGVRQFLDDLEDAKRCLKAEADEDGDSLSDLESMASPRDLGSNAGNEGDEPDSNREGGNLDPGFYEGNAAALARDHKDLHTALAGDESGMLAMLETWFDKDEDDLKRYQAKDDVERGYAGDSEA